MAVLRTYDKDGVLLASGTSPVDNGGLCWIGGDHYLGCSTTRLRLFSWDGTAGGTIKALLTFNGTNVFGVSVEIPHTRIEDAGFTENMRPDGSHVMVTQRVIAFESNFFVTRYFDLSAGNVAEAYFHSFGLAGFFGGVAHSGHLWWFGFTNAIPTNLVVARELDGVLPLNVGGLSFQSTGISEDMCHDGRVLWTLEGGAVHQYNIALGAASDMKSFSLAGGDHRGLTTNGHNLLILSDT